MMACSGVLPFQLELTSELMINRKLLKHWAQSYLLGIPVSRHRHLEDAQSPCNRDTTMTRLPSQRIEVGFRDQSGILQSVRDFETLRIPDLYVLTYTASNAETDLGPGIPMDCRTGSLLHHLRGLLINALRRLLP
jgi:hypothetical protein